MRLTLRTMLAYMDEILEPEDARELGKKIEESEFASNLLARIRDVMRRLRLGAPGIRERGAVLDPNTVAEYLDNTLSGERVPDFEKVCLESDVHLAEVASCHQVLTLVLGEPAEVDPASRQRMYDLPKLAAAQAKSADQAQATVQPAAPGAGDGKAAVARKASPPSRPSRPTVPEYLREPPKKRRFWPVAAALFLAGFLTVVVLAALGQFDPNKPLGRLLSMGGGGREVAQAPSDGAVPEETPKEAAEPSETLEQPEVAEPKPEEPEMEPADQPAEKPPLPEDVKPQPEKPPVGEPAPGVVPPVKPEVPQTPPKPAEVAPKPGAKLEVPPKPEAKPDTVDTTVKPEPEKPGMEKPAVEKPTAEKPGEPVAEPAPPPEEVLGRLVSEKQVVLRLSPRQPTWQRVGAQANVSAKHQLLALPPYRPQVALTAAAVQLIGGTQIELLPADPQGVAGMSITFGRVAMRSVGKAGTQLRIQAEGCKGVVTLADPDSAVAIAVSRNRIVGSNPETEPDPVTVQLYAVSGRVGWAPAGDGQPVVVDSVGLLTLSGPPAAEGPAAEKGKGPAQLRSLPTWITDDTTGVLDRQAAGTIEQALTADRPAQLGLKELVDHRKREVHWLAMRCLGYLGDFDAIIAGLNNADERLVWVDYIGLLDEALGRGPQSVAAIRLTAEKKFGQEGAALARMLYGYTDDGLKAGDASKLVGCLDHPELAFRVLSFWNLKGITGWGLFYQPEAPEAKRKQSVQKWRERLASGAILRSVEGGEAEKPAPQAPPPAEIPSSEGDVR